MIYFYILFIYIKSPDIKIPIEYLSAYDCFGTILAQRSYGMKITLNLYNPIYNNELTLIFEQMPVLTIFTCQYNKKDIDTLNIN